MDYKQTLDSLLDYPTFEQLLQESIALSRQKNPKITNYNVGGAYRTLLEVNSEAIKQLYDLVKEHIVPNMFVMTARGKWLDAHAATFGITRKPAKKAKGYLLFRRTDISGNVLIPKGTIVKTTPNIFGEELKFITIEEKVLIDGQAEISIQIEAEEPGAKYNVGEGVINTLTTYISGIDEIYNPADWLTEEGTDEETDESLRNRILLVWATKSIFTDDYYRFHTLSVDGVVDCYIDNQHPRGQGTADIYIVSSSGMPTTDLITQVQTVIDEIKTPAADIQVKSPTGKPVDLDITITSYSDYPDKTLIQTEAERRINALFVYNPDYKEVIFDYESRRFTIGKSVVLSTIYYVLMEIEGVERVNINSPTADITVNPNELPTLQNLTLQVV